MTVGDASMLRGRSLGLRSVRTRPVTIALVVVLTALWIVALTSHGHGPFAPDATGVSPEALLHRRWWTLATSLLGVSGLAQFVFTLVGAVVGIGWAERVLGSRRTLLAFAITGIAATLVGLALMSLGVAVHEFWASSVQEELTVDPITPIAGTVAWATAAASPLWRRRIRTLLVAGASALLLYSGQPADLYLLVAIALGWVLGRRTLGRRVVGPRHGSMHETRSLLALTTVMLAIGPVLTLLSASRYGMLSPLGLVLSATSPRAGVGQHIACVVGNLTPGCVGALTREHLGGVGLDIVSIAPFVLMLIGARGLATGRRAAVWMLAALGFGEAITSAWYLGIVPAIGSSWAAPVPAGRYGELVLSLVVSILVPAAFAVILLRFRSSFPVRPAARRTRTYLIVLGTIAIAMAAAYLVVGVTMARGFSPTPSLLAVVHSLPERFLPVSFLRAEPVPFQPTDAVTRVVTFGVGPVFWLSLVVATVVLLRRGRDAPAGSTDARRVRRLLRTGSDSLGFLATWAGTRLWTSADGTVGIPYRLVDGHAITVADPIGADRDVLDEFLAFCDRAAWVPVFYSVHEPWQALLARRGWQSIPVAEETSLDPACFTTAGRAMQDVRSSVNRAARLGLRVRWAAWSELPSRITAQITAVSEQWMAERDLPELGFTLGGLDELRDPDVLLAVVLDDQSRVLAVTSWLPFWRDGVLVGRTLDAMRRAPESPNGTMEFLIAEAMSRFAEAGLETASLSGSPLATVSSEPTAPLERILALVGRSLEPLYGFRSLLRFKQKFGPSVRTLHLCYSDPLQLPAISLAIARAYLPGFTALQARKLLLER